MQRAQEIVPRFKMLDKDEVSKCLGERKFELS